MSIFYLLDLAEKIIAVASKVLILYKATGKVFLPGKSKRKRNATNDVPN